RHDIRARDGHMTTRTRMAPAQNEQPRLRAPSRASSGFLRGPLWLAASSLLALLVSQPAQAAQTGELQGYIIDAEGVPVAGVVVTQTSPQLIGGAKRATSGDEGDFRFAALETGSYTVELVHPRYLPVQESGITVGIDAVVIRDYLLEPRPL